MRHLGVSASLWSADLADLRTALLTVEPYCDSFHFDVMDGHYVPNLLFGPDQISALRSLSEKPFQLHMMVASAERLVPLYMDCGDVFILHRETCRDWRCLARDLKTAGKRVGIALRVDEESSGLLKEIDLIDLILVMGTALGIKGAAIAPTVYQRVSELRTQIKEGDGAPVLQADGGIRKATVPLLRQAGIDAITAGSLLFATDRAEFQKWLESV